MEVIAPCNPVDSSTKLVSPYRVERLLLRREYSELLINSLGTIAQLDLRDKNGKIIEHGYSIVESILHMERQRKDISEQIEIIGEDKWNKLKEIWARMRQIELEDKNLISDSK